MKTYYQIKLLNSRLLIRFLGFLIFCSASFAIQSCTTKSKKEIIIGKWQVDSIMLYNRGQKRFFKPGLNEKEIVSTIYNPRILDFNEFGEKVEYRLNDYQNRTITRYDIFENDTKIKFTYSKPEKSDYNLSIWQIDLFENDHLQYSTVGYSIESRQAFKFYLSKVIPKVYDTKQLLGKWLIKYSINYISGEPIKIDSTLRQVFNFTKDNFQLSYDTDNNYVSNSKFEVKGDSLLLDGWANFYIFDCDENNLILMDNSGIKLFGDVPGITSYHVKVAVRMD